MSAHAQGLTTANPSVCSTIWSWRTPTWWTTRRARAAPSKYCRPRDVQCGLRTALKFQSVCVALDASHSVEEKNSSLPLEIITQDVRQSGEVVGQVEIRDESLNTPPPVSCTCVWRPCRPGRLRAPQLLAWRPSTTREASSPPGVTRLQVRAQRSSARHSTQLLRLKAVCEPATAAAFVRFVSLVLGADMSHNCQSRPA